MKQTATRIFTYLFGYFVFSIGSAMTVKSGLGVTATTALPYALNQITGLRIGEFMFLMAIVYVVLQIVVLRKEFQVKNIGQIACGLILGGFVDLSSFLLSGIAIESYFHKLLFVVCGILLIGLGLSMIINMKILPTPAEGFALSISQKSGISLPKIKIVVDCVTLLLSLLLLIVTSHSIENFREGTILSAVFVGACIGVFNRVLSPFYRVIHTTGEKGDHLPRPAGTSHSNLP